MNTNLNLLKSAIARIEDKHEFMAYFLKTYSEIEHISEPQLLTQFNCSSADYYKLALCRVPDVNASDFVQRLEKISEYTNILTIELNKVIKKVNSRLKFTRKPAGDVAMAARDKKKTDDDHEQ